MKIIITLCICLLLLTTCQGKERKDICNEVGEYEFIDLQLLKEKIHLNESTEEDMYKTFGEKVHKRLTYNIPVPRIYKGKYIPIDKLVMYFDAKGEEKKLPNGTIYTNHEKVAVTFFIYKGILRFYSIWHYNAREDKLEIDSTPDVIEFYKIDQGAFWPHQGCDYKYYDAKVLKLPGQEWYTDFASDSCDWEKPNFEEKLKSDGYYDRL